MTMHPVLVTPPVELPIDAADAIKRAPALEGADEEVVTALIEAAVSHLDGWTGILGRCLVEQTWQVRCALHINPIRLPFLDARSPVVRYVVFGGETETIPAEQVYLGRDERGAFVRPVSGAFWPTISAAEDAVEVDFVTGYGAAVKVPSAIKQAIVMMVAGMHATVEASGGLRSFQVDGAFTRQFNSPEMVASVRSNAVDMLLAPFRRMAV